MLIGNYYALTMAANDTASSAFYSIVPTEGGQFFQGSFTIVPSQATTFTVAIYPTMVQATFPASSSINGGITIATSSADTVIAGNVVVSPAVTVPVTFTLYGIGGQPIGSYTLPAGQSEGHYRFEIAQAQAIPFADLQQVMEKLVQA